MKAYIQSVKDRGVELTPEQKAMIAEFEQDDELLDQTGRVDFSKGASALSPEEEAAQEARRLENAQTYAKWEEEEAAKAAPAPVAAAAAPPPPPMAVAAPNPAATVSPATARLWMMQQQEKDAACALLAKEAAGNALAESEARELRALLTSLISTVAQAA